MYSFVPEGWFYRMRPALLFVLPALVSVVPAGVRAQEVASGLFTSHEVIELTLDADFVKLKGDRGLESEYRPAVLTVTRDDGAPRVIDIKVKTRGLFRLRTCR